MTNWTEAIKRAYEAGATDATMYALKQGPKPDVQRYLDKLAKEPLVARFK